MERSNRANCDWPKDFSEVTATYKITERRTFDPLEIEMPEWFDLELVHILLDAVVYCETLNDAHRIARLLDSEVQTDGN